MIPIFLFSYVNRSVMQKNAVKKIRVCVAFLFLLTLQNLFSFFFRSVEMMKENEPIFDVEEVSLIVRETIDENIGNQPYDHNKVNRWSAAIVDHTLTGLGKIPKPFKYIVHAVCR